MDWKYLSSTSDIEVDEDDRAMTATQKGRRNIRHIKDLEDLQVETRIANKCEKERISRLESIELKLREALSQNEYKNELVLDYDFENNLPLISVHQTLVQKMKVHQREGVKFMWNACYESLKHINQSEGSGCILAHCMGLGKTFQVIVLVHTVLSYKQIGTRSILICCPKNTLMNWVNEFQMWITDDLGQINVFNPTRFETNLDRLKEIEEWQRIGGVCIINYKLLRLLLEDDKRKEYGKFYECLCDPGADLVICDEGHILKNEETKLSKTMNRIRTMRRIILTGTPLQNNLKEYHCMIQFVKPSLLGTRQEFVNMFVNPILNGQYENSLVEDVQLMKERSHILHKKLSGCVQRFDLSTLKSYLPEKREYVISVALTNSQVEMYKFYLGNYSAKGDSNWKNDGVALFADYQSLHRIWTHPLTLKMYADKLKGEKKKKTNNNSKAKRKKKTNDAADSTEESTDSETFHWCRFPPLWWLRFVSSDDLEDARQSNKLFVLLHILKQCEEAGEKLLVFSGSLYSLRLIEHFLRRIHHTEFENPSLCNLTSTWEEEMDYLVLTGQTSSADRDRFCRAFNDQTDTRLRLFLISTKAGGMGINLTAANRAVLFDVSWNPSHDIQSVFRIYRIGQRKPCFVYRFVAAGTMEEKIYERQVAKESISHRVVDEKQIARHYTQRELLELYRYEPMRKKEEKRAQVQDPLLRETLFECLGKAVAGVHEHDTLLEHKQEEELQELEKKDAWIAYNNVDQLENLPPNVRLFLSQLKPESFDPFYLRMVLQTKYPEASDKDISCLVTELMPRIKNILERHDFPEVMKRQALYLFAARPKSSKQKRKLKADRERRRKRVEEQNNKTIDLTNTPQSAEAIDRNDRSDSDDSVFLYNITRKRKGVKGGKGRRKPLKTWGVIGGKQFGSPERDSSD